MELSVFLAKVFGVYLFTISVSMFVRRERITAMIKELTDCPAMLTLGMFVALIIGILLVVSHNVWVMGWPLLITLLGWWTLLEAMLILFFPNVVTPLMKALETKAVYNLTGGLCFLLALFLLCKGFL